MDKTKDILLKMEDLHRILTSHITIPTHFIIPHIVELIQLYKDNNVIEEDVIVEEVEETPVVTVDNEPLDHIQLARAYLVSIGAKGIHFMKPENIVPTAIKNGYVAL